MKKSKVAIIGAGNVGSTTAYAIMLKNLASEIILVDINEIHCIGEIYDLDDALSFSYTSSIKKGTPQQAAQADIIIITAGKKQEPGQDRRALLETNKKVISDIFNSLKPVQKHAIVIIVTNPLDILTLHAQQVSGLSEKQVFGSGTYLDSQRLRGFIAKKLNVAEQSVEAYILGEHGDTQFPAWSCADIGGAPIKNFKQMTESVLHDMAEETRLKAYEIIKCKGATFFGIATCVADICENIIFNQKRIMPLSIFVKELGVCLSLPVVLGAHGIEKILELPLDNKEKELLKKSAESLEKMG